MYIAVIYVYHIACLRRYLLTKYMVHDISVFPSQVVHGVYDEYVLSTYMMYNI